MEEKKTSGSPVCMGQANAQGMSKSFAPSNIWSNNNGGVSCNVLIIRDEPRLGLPTLLSDVQRPLDSIGKTVGWQTVLGQWGMARARRESSSYKRVCDEPKSWE